MITTCLYCEKVPKTRGARTCQWHRAQLRDAVYESRLSLSADELLHHTHNHRTYGLSCEQFDALIDRSGKCCEVCRDPLRVIGSKMRKPSLWVEHNHATGFVRGLVCPTCNQIIRAVEEGTREPDARVARFLAAEFKATS